MSLYHVAIEPDVVRNMIRCAVNGPSDPLYPELTSQKPFNDSQRLLGQILTGLAEVGELRSLPAPTQRLVKMALSEIVSASPRLNAEPNRVNATPALEDFEVVARLAQIPTDFPSGGDSRVLRELSDRFGRVPLLALLAYLWIKSGQAKQLLNGAPPPQFGGSTIDPTRNVGGTLLLGGLLFALRAGWIVVEPEQMHDVLRILPLWGRALMHRQCANELRCVPELIGFDWKTSSEGDCAAHSDEWIDAAMTLASRRIPLRDNKRTEHSQRWWKVGYFQVLAESYSGISIEEAARLWHSSTSEVTRHAIELAFADRRVPDPRNPFRNPVAALTLALGFEPYTAPPTFYTPPPTFDEADAHLSLAGACV